jgi:phosphorylcholine metabolism protein LicD
MEYYIVKESGAHVFYTIVNENCDLSFFYKNNLYLKNEIEISFFVNERKDHKSEYVSYLHLEDALKTKDIFMVQSIEKDYEIRFSGGELWVFSFSKEKAEKIFNLLDIV